MVGDDVFTMWRRLNTGTRACLVRTGKYTGRGMKAG